MPGSPGGAVVRFSPKAKEVLLRSRSGRDLVTGDATPAALLSATPKIAPPSSAALPGRGRKKNPDLFTQIGVS